MAPFLFFFRFFPLKPPLINYHGNILIMIEAVQKEKTTASLPMATFGFVLKVS